MNELPTPLPRQQMIQVAKADPLVRWLQKDQLKSVCIIIQLGFFGGGGITGKCLIHCTWGCLSAGLSPVLSPNHGAALINLMYK